MEENVARLRTAPPAAIEQRLRELEQEWDIERALQANAATVDLIGLALGAAVHAAWFLLPTAVAAFLLQPALQGWCPPASLCRRLGFRTMREIDEERFALKILRGDCRYLVEPTAGNVSINIGRLLDAVRRRGVHRRPAAWPTE